MTTFSDRLTTRCHGCDEEVVDSVVGWDNHRCEPKHTRGSSDRDSYRDLNAWVTALGLTNWSIRIADPDDFDVAQDEDAYVYKDRRERYATIHINPEATNLQAERLLVHELLHLVLDDLQFLAMNDRSVAIMDVVDTELERVINTLSTALTGTGWEPVHPRVREAHGYRPEA